LRASSWAARRSGLFDLLAGVAALAFAFGFRAGRVSMRGAGGAGRALRHPRARRRASHEAAALPPSVLTAALAGVLTHSPA
jgi:hypothetical protein